MLGAFPSGVDTVALDWELGVVGEKAYVLDCMHLEQNFTLAELVGEKEGSGF